MKVKRRVVNAVVTSVLAVIAISVAVAMLVYVNSFEHEKVADRFSKGTRFTQITLFIPASEEFTVDKVMYFRYNLENKLTEKAVTPENEGARLYVDAYSSYSDATLNSSGNRTTNAKIAFIGGDYKLFHSEFSELPDIANDINHDRILLSRSAAWQLYGGTELYDYTAQKGDKTYLISGVFEDFKGKEYDQFYEERTAAVADMQSEAEMPITCYELIVVDPVKNFGIDTVKECIDLSEGSYYIVENSKRFSLSKLFAKIPELVQADKPLPTGVEITPEEIAARRAEKVLAAMLIVFLVFAVYPFIWLLILVYRLIRMIKKGLNKYVFGKIKDKFSYS